MTSARWPVEGDGDLGRFGFRYGVVSVPVF